MDKENKKKYQKKMDASRICLRLNARERSVLENKMREEGWENMSGYIRYKLFGIEPDKEIKMLIRSKDPWAIANLLRNEVFELTEQYLYVVFRYNKDMAQLYREEGVDVKEWAKATNEWHAALTRRTEQALGLISDIAKALGLEAYFKRPSDNMHVDFDEHDPDKLDALAEQLRKERVAYGGPDIF